MSSESTIEKDSKKKLAAAAAAAAARDEERDEDDKGDEDEVEERVPVSRRGTGGGEKVVVARPSSIQMIWTIARRELSGFFHSPITYIVGAASFALFGLWFFFYKGGFWQVDRATMTRMFDTVPAALCAVIPLFTMRSLSDEKRVGTIELLITMPVKDSEVILGKFVAALLVVTLQIALLAIYPIAMFLKPWHLGELDWNAYWVGMIGLVFMASAGTAIGLMWSSFTESQILSYFATALTLVALYAIGSVSIVEFLQGWPGDAVSFISIQSRFDAFARGILDTRNIVYFVSLTVLALFVAFRSLESRKWT